MTAKLRAPFSRIVAAALWATVLIPGSALAGPPFRTDDPEPVDYQHWEFYTFSTGTTISDDTSGVLPGFEFNYGIFPNAMVHVIAPLAFDAPTGGPTQFGYGDTELGFKYRFIDLGTEKNPGFEVATFPLVEVPTGAQSHGLGAGHVSVFLPIWVQDTFGDWTTYGGGGYWLNQNDHFGDKDYWFTGWVLQRKITDQLSLGGELYHQTANKVGGKDTTAFNLGGTYDFDEHHHFLFSVGRALQNASSTNQLSWYVAYQLTY